MPDHDAQLLNRFATKGDEAAFRELVARNFDLVYSVALRQLNGDVHLAQDVAQTVFTDLARKAPVLRGRIVLTGWLYEAARRVAAKTVRTEQRRRHREKEATMMTTESEPGGEWEQVAPLLEVAMSQLSASDRHAILLYYFEQRGFRAVGAALGISDDAAQKRVTRALPKLRSILLRRGATISITSLATVLTASAVSAAPPGLAYGVSTASIANALATPAGWTALSCEALQLAKVKQAISIASLVFLIGASGWLLRSAMLTGFGRFTPLNLSQHYNGDLRKSWTDIYPGNDLSALPRGRQRFHKVPFDIRGVVQLQGRQLELKGLQLPERVRDIPVNDTGRRLHLLHATSACAPATGTQLAALVLHYSDGAQAEIPIRQGVHCFDWWAWNEAPPSDPNTTVAWVGQNEAARNQGINVQLFQTAFSNPAPAKLIATIDYVSSMSCSAPFMVGLTVEH